MTAPTPWWSRPLHAEAPCPGCEALDSITDQPWRTIRAAAIRTRGALWLHAQHTDYGMTARELSLYLRGVELGVRLAPNALAQWEQTLQHLELARHASDASTSNHDNTRTDRASHSALDGSLAIDAPGESSTSATFDNHQLRAKFKAAILASRLGSSLKKYLAESRPSLSAIAPAAAGSKNAMTSSATAPGSFTTRPYGTTGASA